jgi:hypothetical protein
VRLATRPLWSAEAEGAGSRRGGNRLGARLLRLLFAHPGLDLLEQAGKPVDDCRQLHERDDELPGREGLSVRPRLGERQPRHPGGDAAVEDAIAEKGGPSGHVIGSGRRIVTLMVCGTTMRKAWRRAAGYGRPAWCGVATARGTPGRSCRAAAA